jgi:hypothetical protein
MSTVQSSVSCPGWLITWISCPASCSLSCSIGDQGQGQIASPSILMHRPSAWHTGFLKRIAPPGPEPIVKRPRFLRDMVWSLDEPSFGFQCGLPPGLPMGTIFFAEALAVCSVVHSLPDTDPMPHRVAIYTDNSNTVDIFNSLRASAPYNRILMSAVDVLITHNIDLHVYHVPGHENVIADALSRFHNDVALRVAPGLVINSFTPPRDAMGASE